MGWNGVVFGHGLGAVAVTLTVALIFFTFKPGSDGASSAQVKIFRL